MALWGNAPIRLDIIADCRPTNPHGLASALRRNLGLERSRLGQNGSSSSFTLLRATRGDLLRGNRSRVARVQDCFVRRGEIKLPT
jgi:hypothetical protein